MGADVDNEPIPSSDVMDGSIISPRLAYLTMLKSKDELVAMYREMDPETNDEILTWLEETSERLKGMAGMVDEAKHRLLVAGTAYVLS